MSVGKPTPARTRRNNERQRKSRLRTPVIWPPPFVACRLPSGISTPALFFARQHQVFGSRYRPGRLAPDHSMACFLRTAGSAVPGATAPLLVWRPYRLSRYRRLASPGAQPALLRFKRQMLSCEMLSLGTGPSAVTLLPFKRQRPSCRWRSVSKQGEPRQLPPRPITAPVGAG
jgi:hypothetical protein